MFSGRAGVDIFHLTEGNIMEMWANYNTLNFMQQLGVIPIP
jgi:hypothetical protein